MISFGGFGKEHTEDHAAGPTYWWTLGLRSQCYGRLSHLCPLDIPKMVPNFVRIPLHDVERGDRAGFRMRGVVVAWCVEGGVLPRVGRFMSAINPTTGESES